MADDERQQTLETESLDTQGGEGGESLRGLIQALESDSDIPKIYANEIGIAHSHTDFVLILARSSTPQAVLYLPPQTIKGFVATMTSALKKLEETANGDSHDNSIQ